MFNDYLRICFAIRECEGIRGRKRIHKLFYLSKQAGVPIDAQFEWNNYGPYSMELASFIDSLDKIGYIKEVSEDLDFGERYSYYIEEMGVTFLIKSKTESEKSYEHFSRILRELNKMDTKTLERYASIHYLMNEGFSEEYLKRFLKYTKKYSDSEIEEGKKEIDALLPLIRKEEFLSREDGKNIMDGPEVEKE